MPWIVSYTRLGGYGRGELLHHFHALVRRISTFVATVVLLAAWALPAAGQPPETELDRAWQAMFDDPTDIDATLRYATLATEAGDYEAAIGALERLLLLSPGLPSVHADLGLLYHRMGSQAAARFHVRRALEAPDVSPDVAARAQYVLARIEQAEDASSFRASLTVGARYQSNANSGPSSATVLASGFNVALDEEFQEEDDVNLFGLARLHHGYRLRGIGATLDTEAFAFGTLHEQVHEVNNLTLEASTGPRFDIGNGLSVRPHVVGNLVWRGNDFNSKVIGAGLDARYEIGNRARLAATYQHRVRDFTNSDRRRFVDLRDGNEDHFSADAVYAFTRNLSGIVRATLISRDTRRAFLDSGEYGVTARLALRHASPFGFGPQRWFSHLLVGLRRIDFDAPNPAVDPARTRRDDEIRFGAGTSADLSRHWRAGLRLSYSDVDSNLPNFTRDNLAVSLSATRRF